MSTLKQVFSCFGSQGREGTSREKSIFPITGSLPWDTTQSPSPTQAISFEKLPLIPIIIFDTYILTVDTYYSLSHQVAPSLMAQSEYLPAPVAESGLASTAGLELQGAETRQPAAKPHPHRLLPYYNWCYSEEQKNSYGNIPCVLKKKNPKQNQTKKKTNPKQNKTHVLEFSGPKIDLRLNTLTQQISVIKARGFMCVWFKSPASAKIHGLIFQVP